MNFKVPGIDPNLYILPIRLDEEQINADGLRFRINVLELHIRDLSKNRRFSLELRERFEKCFYEGEDEILGVNKILKLLETESPKDVYPKINILIEKINSLIDSEMKPIFGNSNKELDER